MVITSIGAGMLQSRFTEMGIAHLWHQYPITLVYGVHWGSLCLWCVQHKFFNYLPVRVSTTSISIVKVCVTQVKVCRVYASPEKNLFTFDFNAFGFGVDVPETLFELTGR